MYQDFRYTLAHAQTVCTRPSFGPGDEATNVHANAISIEINNGARLNLPSISGTTKLLMIHQFLHWG